MERLISFLGLVVFVALAWLMGERRKSIDLRIVLGGLLLQFGLALFIFKTPIGAAVFQAVGYFFESLLGASSTPGRALSSERSTRTTSSLSRCCRPSFSFRRSCSCCITWACSRR